ncbi:hypothetical protein SAMN05661091_2221 [Paenibacillus uliginis N3/975]|uniref:Alpha/beta hydrolase n=1 Tax=Paenibacillus uliginis N3/975 TaxID=1313296 RepID=A0A1X7HAJ1_9BACL|nr:hypothetical protein [Paenibacillus uliginis]SMF82687.1 hypothetical protein SAMN05661091_2221 [Paenibacillus uliginis N3/975]
MKIQFITLPSAWGRDVQHRLFSQSSSTLVVLFPGKNYSCELPLLYYATQVALQHHCDVLQLEYGYQSARTELQTERLHLMVEESVKAIHHIKDQYKQIIFVSKSLGTVVAGIAAEAVDASSPIVQLFLTPLDSTVSYIQNTVNSVIYGTADDLFSDKSVKALEGLQNSEVHAVNRGSHSLEVGNARDNIKVMADVIGVYETFFKKHVLSFESKL